MSCNITEQEVRDLFTPHGPVTSVHLVMDKLSGLPRGFGFVTMETKAGAQAAIQTLHGSSVDGRSLTVNEARPRESRPSPRGSSANGRRSSFGGGRDYRTPRREYIYRF